MDHIRVRDIPVQQYHQNYLKKLNLFCLNCSIPFTTKIGKERIDKNNIRHKIAYYITVANKEFIRKMSSYINDDVTITDGKGEKSSMKIYDNKILYPIKQVEKIHYSGDVYNIEVENDNTYTGIRFYRSQLFT